MLGTRSNPPPLMPGQQTTHRRIGHRPPQALFIVRFDVAGGNQSSAFGLPLPRTQYGPFLGERQILVVASAFGPALTGPSPPRKYSDQTRRTWLTLRPTACAMASVDSSWLARSHRHWSR